MALLFEPHSTFTKHLLSARHRTPLGRHWWAKDTPVHKELLADRGALWESPWPLTPTPPQDSITNIRCARSPVERGPVCELNPLSLWPGQEQGGPEKKAGWVHEARWR